MLKINLPEGIQETDQLKAVIKINVGKYYYISRAITFKFIKDELTKTYAQYKYSREGAYTDHLYFPIVVKMVEKAIETVSFEIVFTSQSGYEVLKEELKLLQESFGKKMCLNANSIPYVAKFKTPKSTSKWLTHNEFLNFKKLLSKISPK